MVVATQRPSAVVNQYVSTADVHPSPVPMSAMQSRASAVATHQRNAPTAIPQGSLVSRIVCARYTSGLTICDAEQFPGMKVLPGVNNVGWVATWSNVNQIISTLKACAAQSQDSAGRRVLEFDTA